jgi:hypothetical protein
LPQDPVAEQNHHLEAKKLQEVGDTKVQDLLSTYGFAGRQTDG